MTDVTALTATTLAEQVEAFLRAHDPAATPPVEFHRARFAAGLAWVHFPKGLGGLGLDRAMQTMVDDLFRAAGEPSNEPELNLIGLNMAAPAVLRFGSAEQQQRWLEPLWAAEEFWCQLFSESGAGSDLAAVATSARRDGDSWVVNGQKVWTSAAQIARWGLLLARTDPTVAKHKGLTLFACDMGAPGVQVRPLRQLTGECEFNQVFLDDVRVPDAHRLGDVGEGWTVASHVLMNERITLGGGTTPRESGAIGELMHVWRSQPLLRTSGLHEQVLRLWVEAEAARLASNRFDQQQATGAPGPEGSAIKLTRTRLDQQISSLELDLLGLDGLLYNDYTATSDVESHLDRDAGWRYLWSKAESIAGGTSEILRNIVAERVLGLPPEPRADKEVAWKDLPR